MYWVTSLADFDEVTLREGNADDRRVRPTRVRTIVSPKPGEVVEWTFPLVEKYRVKNQTALGRDLTTSASGHREEPYAEPPTRVNGGSASSSSTGPPLPPPLAPPGKWGGTVTGRWMAMIQSSAKT